jgi:hypothetical protein
VAAVASEFETIRARTAAVDAEVLSRADASGGTPLACLASLAFRQSFAANELALHDGRVFYFSKGMDISGASPVQSLDVLYASSAALLAFNPALLKFQLAPILEALDRGDWRESEVMEDLGTYPVVSGQGAGTAPRTQATAELILLARMSGSPLPPDRFVKAFPGPDPAPGALRAMEAAGGRLPTALFVDRLLDLTGLKEDELAREASKILGRAGKYGTPLEPKKSTVHVDALLWIAAIATAADREAFASQVMRFYADSSVRVPPADRYEGDTARPWGTQGRPVLGAVFAPLLLSPARGER